MRLKKWSRFQLALEPSLGVFFALALMFFGPLSVAQDYKIKKPVDIYQEPSEESRLLIALPPGSVINVRKSKNKNWLKVEYLLAEDTVSGFVHAKQLKKNLIRPEEVKVKKKRILPRLKDELEKESMNHISSRFALGLNFSYGSAMQTSQTLITDFGQIAVDDFSGSTLKYGLNFNIPLEEYTQLRLSVLYSTYSMNSTANSLISSVGSSKLERDQTFVQLGAYFKPYAGDERKYYILAGMEFELGVEVKVKSTGNSTSISSSGDLDSQIGLAVGFGREWTLRKDRAYLYTEGLFSLIFSDPITYNLGLGVGFSFLF